jgi:hypothetical protein
MWALLDRDRIPAEDEGPEKGANEDAHDKIPVIVHRQQHDEIGHTKLQHMQECSDKLLLHVRLAWPRDEKIVPSAR